MLRRALLLGSCAVLVASVHSALPPVLLAEAESVAAQTNDAAGGAVIFDNHVVLGGLHSDGATPASQYDAAFPFDAGAADDFVLPESPECTWRVTGVRWWGTYWGDGEPGGITGFRIVFWPDEGGIPAGAALPFPQDTPDYSQALAVYDIPGPASESPDGSAWRYEAQLPDPFPALAGVPYWIQIQSQLVSGPQWGWHVTTGRAGNGPVVYFDLLGMPVWTAHSDPGDLAFQLLGEPHEIVCDDGNACTADGCIDGQCVFTAIVCDDESACTTDSCDPATGCVFDPIECDDGDACTENTCDPDTGCVFTPIVCDDTDECTADACDPVDGCVFDPVECNDQNACTDDLCDPATGCAFTEIDCDDGDACTEDSCDPSAGCVHVPVTCDDGDACTQDSCDPQTGCAHTPVECDDDHACTDDACDPATGCVFPTIECDDGSLCTADTCDPAAGCVFTPVECDDGDACTENGCDPAAGCTVTPVDCDDGDACTGDSCDPASGCVHTQIPCSDGDACTQDACDPQSGCVFTELLCDDDDSCTTDSCDPQTGCAHTPVDCDDGDPCTLDECADGECVHTLDESCGDTETDDCAAFHECMTGPMPGPLAPQCECRDSDGDGDVDLFDWLAFEQQVINGS